jgi:hypothetical protein
MTGSLQSPVDRAMPLGIPHTTVADSVRRARVVGLTWPLPDELSDVDALDSRLFTRAVTTIEVRPQPDFAVVQIELLAKGITLLLLWMEFKELHPDADATLDRLLERSHCFELIGDSRRERTTSSHSRNVTASK